MLPFVVTGLGAAVGAVAGAIASQASREEDRQKIKQYEIANTELVDKYNNLVQFCEQLSARREQQANELDQKLADFEAEKKLLNLVIRLQQELIALMTRLEQNISLEVLETFEEAVEQTNIVLKSLALDLVTISSDYLIQQRNRVKEQNFREQKSQLQIQPIKQQNQTNQKRFYLEDCLL